MTFLTAVLISAFTVNTYSQTIIPDRSAVPHADTVRMDRLVVTGSRAATTTGNLPLSVSVITDSRMENRMEQSVLPLLVEHVPGLMITSRGIMGYGASTGAAGGMTMRGVGGGAGTLMLIDGHPQFMGIFSHPLADTYQTLIAERIEVVRGPASVLYGSNAMGGTINILTRQRHEDGSDVRFRAMHGSHNTTSTEFGTGVRKGGFNTVMSAGYNRSDGHRPNMDFEQYSGYGKLGYDFTRNWKTFVDLNLSKILSSNPGATARPMLDNDMDILRGIASLSLQNDYERTSGAVKMFYNFGTHLINDGYAAEGGTPGLSRFNSTDRMLGLTLFQNYSFFRGNQTTVGFDFQRYGGRSWNSWLNGNPDAGIAAEYVDNYAGYVNLQQLLWKKLTVNAGIRFDRHQVAGGQWIPQLGLSFAAGRNTVLKAIASKGYRNPTIRELYMFGNRNPELRPESIMNYEISVSRYMLDRRMALELNLYYINGKNSIILVGERPGKFMNTGKLKNAGIEFSMDYRILQSFIVNANYSFIRMKHKIEGTPVHKLYAGADYTLKKWTFSTGLQYVHDLVLEDGRESFALLNARVSFRAARRLMLMVRGENLLDTRYMMYTGYPMPGATAFGGISLNF